MREDILTKELQKVSSESQRRELYSMDWLDDKDKIIEGAFAECYLKMHPMICIHGILFTIDGIVSDETLLAQIPFVDDVPTEQEKVDEEKESNPFYDTRLGLAGEEEENERETQNKTEK